MGSRDQDAPFIESKWVGVETRERRMSRSVLRVSCFVFHVSDFGIRDSGFGFRIAGFRFRDFGLQDSDFGVGCRGVRSRGRLVVKAHRLCVSLNSRLESNKEEEEGCGGYARVRAVSKGVVDHMGTSLIRNSADLGPYSRTRVER